MKTLRTLMIVFAFGGIATVAAGCGDDDDGPTVDGGPGGDGGGDGSTNNSFSAYVHELIATQTNETASPDTRVDTATFTDSEDITLYNDLFP